MIEADFFGNENAAFVDANGFRLRHAYVQMSWKKTQLLFGQYWHPLFIPACYSEVISFNTGAPIQPFSRNPQIKIVHAMGKFSVAGTLSSQRDFTSPGGSNGLRNSALPEINGQVQYQTQTGKSKTDFLAGIGAGYKELTPLLFTEGSAGKFATDETVSSYSFTAFAKMQTAKSTVKVQWVYGSNLYDLTMLGGYAVKEVLDLNRNSVSYTPIKTMALWAEFQTSVKNILFGLWTGYTQNLGASAPIAYYSDGVNGSLSTVRGSNIKSILRISPRVVLVSGKFNFALETEYTNAGYAAKDENGVLYRDSQGVITRADHVSNLRVLYSVILKF